MKIIEVVPTTYDIRCLYRKAKTKYHRELLGYMLQTGRTDNLTLGGAFHLLEELNKVPRAETYTLAWENEEIAKEIIAVTEAARARAFRKFALSRWEVRRTSKNISSIFED